MTSKISYFKIARDDLRHRTWMIALSCLGSLLALPIFFLFVNDGYLESYTWNLSTFAPETARRALVSSYMEHLQFSTVITCGVILFVGALIVGLFGYRHLYSRKMVDLYHSIPVKRETLFLIHYINGFLIWLLPMLISFGITLLLMLVNMLRCNCADSFGTLLSIAGSDLVLFLLAFLTVYNFTLVCVMLCGNAFNAICLTVLGGVLVCGLWVLNAAYSDIYLSTYVMPTIALRQLSFASPLVNAVVILTECSNTHIFAGDGLLLCLSLCMIVVTFVAALLLHRSRPSELAEHGIENRPVQHVIRVAISIAAGLSLAGIFILISGSEAYGWILFGIILGAFLAFGILNIIFHMDFRAFLKHRGELLLTIAAACLLLPVYRFDLTGYNARLPRQSDIVSVRYMIYPLADEMSSIVSDISYEDNAKLYTLLETLTDKAHLEGAYDVGDNYGYAYTNFTIYLRKKNGREFARTYRLYASDMELLRGIVEDDRYREAYYPISSGLYRTPEALSIGCNMAGQTYHNLTAEQREAIMGAYSRDFQKHYTLEELISGVKVCDLQMRFESDEGYVHYLYLPVQDSYTETISTILRYYPECPITRDNLDVAAIDFTPDISTSFPGDILYSYFALDGYPSYDEYWENYMETWDVPADDGTIYFLHIDDPDEMEQLYPYLHIGSLYRTSLYDVYQRGGYIHLGSLLLTNGSRVTCYVKEGELPREWIDRLEIVPQEVYDQHYDTIDYYDEYYDGYYSEYDYYDYAY